MELVRFDMQLMQNPEILGLQYQQGQLAGYEVREYLLEKWNRTCVYCGKKIGCYVGRVAVRASGSFNIKTDSATIQGIGWKYCRLMHASDGYTYWY